jgi:ABC-type multidrug transport system ATPase subunit
MRTDRTEESSSPFKPTDGLSLKFERVTVRSGEGRKEANRNILEEISFEISPGEFICVLGPSGAGKSTLVRSILGETDIASGSILVNGMNLDQVRPQMRGRIGYVPQADIIPLELTVERALHYAAAIRLPEAFGTEDRREAVTDAMKELRLTEVADRPIRLLSGGEAKRASLAAELLSNPGLLILDEATSSLDPATEARIMGLLAEQAKLGTSILAVTHHLDNVDRAHKLLILGGGRIVWFGTAGSALKHFQVERLSDIYLEIEDKPDGYWVDRWKSYLDATKKDQEPESYHAQSSLASSDTFPERLPSISFFRQLSTLFQRGMESFFRDKGAVGLALLLPIALAMVVLISFSETSFHDVFMVTRVLEPSEKQVLADVWGEVREAITPEQMPQNSAMAGQIRLFLDSQPKLLAHLREDSTERIVTDALTDRIPIAPEKEIIDPSGTYKLISLMSIIVMILGFVVGYKEIVKERSMFELERMHGLGCIPYVLAKILILALTLAVQVAIFTYCVEIGLHLKERWGGLAPVAQYRRGASLEFLLNWLSALACAAISLVVSSLVKATDKGVMTIPLLITPQVLLSATILPIRGGILKFFAMIFSPLYWAHRGCRSEAAGVPSIWKNLGEYNPHIAIPLVALFVQILSATILTVTILHYQSRRRKRASESPSMLEKT